MACCRCGNSIICHVFTILILAAGVVMSCLTIYDCKFLTTSAGDTIGLFSYVNLDDQCVMYNGDPYGWLQTWAWISAVVAPALGAFVIIMIMVEFCSDHFCVDFFRSLLLSFAEISQAFTFVIYGSSACAKDSANEDFADLMLGSCSVSQGSIFSIIAFGLYLIGGIFLCFSPKQKSLCKKGEVDAEPAAEAPGQVEEKPKNDVEAGAASTEDD
eukprot:CAMPEP_0201716224 /NCGR_PEP_ID=MMETSP0593-20130828/2251_1 /ASSEMBLY_ACC=CAM_ASM_000672 /TAXON_ID=267983 /ORGANISM="Skeletonema japonicum, Strain CCMP2506" /LENGTH=213 /DNA_ID=CAMNT_0048205971 /DNA_START=23 /DNA_END=664 /DNA_ORIENTATION=-